MPSDTPAVTPDNDLRGELLNLIQQTIPYHRRPFAVLGEKLGVSEDRCLQTLRELKEDEQIIRQISAIFDTHALGYASSLVAGCYEPGRIEQAARIVSGHPAVSHNYERNHGFNLWYTVAVSPDSSLGLEKTVELLGKLSGAKSTRLLPTLKLFKIGVKLDMSKGSAGKPKAEDDADKHQHAFTEKDRTVSKQFTLSDQDKRMIVVLQQDLPLVEAPFDQWADQAGCDVNDLLAACQQFQDRKQMRRFAAVLRHRKAGFGANAMGLWRAPEENIDEIGAQCATFDEVSHCYHRPAYQDLPYNLYTMVHGKSREETTDILRKIQRKTKLPQFAELWSTREFKKVRVKYFTDDEKAWEDEYGK